MTQQKRLSLDELEGARIHDTLENVYYEVVSVTNKYAIAKEEESDGCRRFPLFGNRGLNSGRYVVID